MSLAQELQPFIPYLRRFGRALTGSQHSGDAYVAATLEALIADRSQLDASIGMKPGLYQVFLSLWRSVDGNTTQNGETVSPGAAAERNLQAISAEPRQAFLLTAVEGFSHEEASFIIKSDVSNLNGLLEQAGKDIASQVATDVMIIEDEPLIAMDIESMVQDLGHGVTGIARTHEEAVQLFAKRKPGIILADIQLADGSSGVDAVNDILAQYSVPVIFITAFPEKLLTGQRPEPTYLVTKPFQPDMVRALISQALFFNETSSAAA